MTFESTKFYISKEKEKELEEILHRNYDKILSMNNEDQAGMQVVNKIKSREIMTRKKFSELIDYMKSLNARMTSIAFYMHTEGECNVKMSLEQKYARDNSIDLVVESNQVHNILTHTDLEQGVTSFMKFFLNNQYTLETEIPSSGLAVYRTKIIDLKGGTPDKTWDFVKEISKGAYFKRE